MRTAGGITMKAISSRSRKVRPRNRRRAIAKAARVAMTDARATDMPVTRTLFMNQTGIRPSWSRVA